MKLKLVKGASTDISPAWEGGIFTVKIFFEVKHKYLSQISKIPGGPWGGGQMPFSPVSFLPPPLPLVSFNLKDKTMQLLKNTEFFKRHFS
jgi:hypothetical protein